MNWIREILFFSQSTEIIAVMIAVEPLKIANIFELEKRDAYENKVKGNALFITARKSMFRKLLLKSFKYFDWSKIGKNINPAINNLIFTKKTGPKSGVAILINIKALPQIAPRKINRSQYLFAMKKKKPFFKGFLYTNWSTFCQKAEPLVLKLLILIRPPPFKGNSKNNLTIPISLKDCDTFKYYTWRNNYEIKKNLKVTNLWGNIF